MLHVIGIPNCDKIRKTKTWLDENNIEYQFVNLKKEPLTLEEIEELTIKVGLDVLVNKRGTTYRKLGLKDKNLSDNELMATLLENQSMIKRPVLVLDEAVLVGYDEVAFQNFVATDEEE